MSETPIQQPTEEVQQADGERTEPNAPEQTIHLPSLISDNYGTPRSEARMYATTGTITIDGELYTGPLDIPRSKILDKQIVVESEFRKYSFKYVAE